MDINGFGKFKSISFSNRAPDSYIPLNKITNVNVQKWRDRQAWTYAKMPVHNYFKNKDSIFHGFSITWVHYTNINLSESHSNFSML